MAESISVDWRNADSLVANLKPKLEAVIDLAMQSTARVVEKTLTIVDRTERRAAQSVMMATIFNNCIDIIMDDIQKITNGDC